MKENVLVDVLIIGASARANVDIRLNCDIIKIDSNKTEENSVFNY